MLRKIGNKLERLEEDIFEGRAEEVVRDLSNSKQEIINFRKVIRPQRAVLRDLERTKQRYLAEDLEVYFDDIVDASERIWDMLENFKEVVEALEDTNESVLSHRVNEVLRVLTAFSVVILPLTLIASIWGMNVGVPGEGDTDGLLDHHGQHGRAARRHGRLLPQARLALTWTSRSPAGTGRWRGAWRALLVGARRPGARPDPQPRARGRPARRRQRAGAVRPRERVNAPSWPQAIGGADAVVFAAGAGPGSGAERKQTMDRDGAIKLLDAAVSAGVPALRDRQLGRRREPAGRRRRLQRLPARQGGGRRGGRAERPRLDGRAARLADRRPGHAAACASRPSRSATGSRATTWPPCSRRCCTSRARRA